MNDLLMFVGKLYVEKEMILLQVAELRARVAQLEGEVAASLALLDESLVVDEDSDES